MSITSLLVYLLATIVSGGAGVFCVLVGSKVISAADLGRLTASPYGVAFLFALGAALIVIFLYFVLLIWQRRKATTRFSQQGEWGRIEISPLAIKDFVSGTLRQEIGLDRFRVKLKHAEGGIAISIHTSLSRQEKVAEVGERIQQTLARRVMERTGVEVGEVSVLVDSVQKRKEQAKEEVGEEDATDDIS